MSVSRPVLIASVLLFLIVFATVSLANRGGGRAPLHIVLLPARPATPDAAAAQISGAVLKPGIYPLPRNARVIDLIDAAGGLLPDADVNRIDEAKRVGDGELVLIPDLSTPAAAAGLVRINHASQAELAALPGVNLSQAAAITGSVRRQGALRSTDDLVARKLMSAQQAAQVGAFVDWSP